MARITSDEIKKILETERDMTVVIDASNRSAKKTCETVEKQLHLMEKHMMTMEKLMQVTEKNAEIIQKSLQAMERNTEMMQQQTSAMEKSSKILERHIQMIENQNGMVRKRSERMRIPSSSSDVMAISPTPPPDATATEPINKRSKYENVPVENRIPIPQSVISQSCNTISPFVTPPMNMLPPIYQHYSQISEQQRPPISLQFKNSSRFDRGRNGIIKLRCIFCSDIHNLHDSEHCPIVKDCKTRERFMTMNFLCVTCAEPRFRCNDAKKCRFLSRKCHYCPANHWNALCPMKYPSTNHFNF
ncbi:unnamed protein product [Caenorhabditis brenneri]